MGKKKLTLSIDEDIIHEFEGKINFSMLLEMILIDIDFINNYKTTTLSTDKDIIRTIGIIDDYVRIYPLNSDASCFGSINMKDAKTYFDSLRVIFK